MEKPSYGLIINKIIEQKNLSKTDLAKKLGISRATVQNIGAKKKFSEEDVKQWANAIGISPEELRNTKEQAQTQEHHANDNFGGEMATKLEEFFGRFEAQLEQKDNQIKALQTYIESQQRQIENQQELMKMVLGKPNEYTNSSVIFTKPGLSQQKGWG